MSIFSLKICYRVQTSECYITQCLHSLYNLMSSAGDHEVTMLNIVYYNLSVRLFPVSRHTVVCQRPRKQKKTCDTQVCYLLVSWSCPNSAFHISETTKLISTNLYIFCLTYTQLYISKLKEIASVVLKIFVPENCLIFFTFFEQKITKIFKSHKNNLFMLRFLSNLEH